MKVLLDTHTHTIASGHSTRDTVTDLARAAAARGLELLCITDHSPSTPGSAGTEYFRSLAKAPRRRFGIDILFGTEADVTDERGSLGMASDILAELDLVIVSQHPPCFAPSADAERNTAALVAAVRGGRADIVGHPDDEKYPLDYPALVRVCSEYGAMIELNEASLRPDGYRGDARAKDAELLRLCRAAGVTVALGSDSHGAAHVGDFTYGLALVRETGFPQELIANRDAAAFRRWLRERRKQQN